MKSLLIVAHGSNREESNEEVRRLTDVLRDRAGGRFAYVTFAFLELAEPSVGQGIDACVAAGAGEVVILPYFLARGRHVVTDIPDQVAPKGQEHPGVRFTIAPCVGAAEGLPELLLSLTE